MEPTPKKLRKAGQLQAWRNMPAGLPILPHFQPIPYKAQGSSYGACGVRIDGSPEFIDAVLSRLKDLIDAENHVTRLELSRSVVKARPGRALNKAAAGAECCYIRAHVRGREGSAMSAYCNRKLDGATERFAGAVGVAV